MSTIKVRVGMSEAEIVVEKVENVLVVPFEVVAELGAGHCC